MNLLRAAAEIARFLEDQGIPYFIIGGLALQHWGEPRLTRDVEGILIRQRLRLDLGLVRRWLTEFREVLDSHDPLELFEEALKRAREALNKEGTRHEPGS